MIRIFVATDYFVPPFLLLLPGFYSPIQAKTVLTMPLHRILSDAISLNSFACWVV
jgi:hypothetical protein